MLQVKLETPLVMYPSGSDYCSVAAALNLNTYRRRPQGSEYQLASSSFSKCSCQLGGGGRGVDDVNPDAYLDQTPAAINFLLHSKSGYKGKTSSLYDIMMIHCSEVINWPKYS